MVNLAKRMRNFQPKLLAVQYGRGAAVLPPPPAPQLTRLVMRYPRLSWAVSNHGPRIFAKESLPRLKYHNPTLPIRVEDSNASQMELTFESTDEASLEVLKNQNDNKQYGDEWSEVQSKPQSAVDASAPSSASPSLPIFTRNGTLPLNDKDPKDIWRWFQKTTSCKDVTRTEQDEILRRQLQAFSVKAAHDRQLVKAGMDDLRKQKADLKRAREAAERLTSEA